MMDYVNLEKMTQEEQDDETAFIRASEERRGAASYMKPPKDLKRPVRKPGPEWWLLKLTMIYLAFCVVVIILGYVLVFDFTDAAAAYSSYLDQGQVNVWIAVINAVLGFIQTLGSFLLVASLSHVTSVVDTRSVDEIFGFTKHKLKGKITVFNVIMLNFTVSILFYGITVFSASRSVYYLIGSGVGQLVAAAGAYFYFIFYDGKKYFIHQVMDKDESDMTELIQALVEARDFGAFRAHVLKLHREKKRFP